jgi:Secretion system C-terminal sorting domain
VKKAAVIVLLISLETAAFAQLAEYGLPHPAATKKGKSASRTQALDPAFLPFWDDFSATDDVLRDTLWLYGQSVQLNNGFGIRPPSRNVVTFDGTDSLGKPYNINDILAKGFADRLISQPIRMDLVPVAERDSVYISFFFQFQGRGELPDPGDQLSLAIKAQDGTWETIYVVDSDPSLPPDVFQEVIVQISEDRFFHDNFQFRFFNYARLSGPYDHWIVDYVYLNKRRFPTDLRFPDRTISGSFTSLFSEYFSMPLKHFMEDTVGNLAFPTIELYNMLEFQVGTSTLHTQPISYRTVTTIKSTEDSVTTSTSFVVDSLFVGNHNGLTYKTSILDSLPSPSNYYYPSADSINVRIKYSITTKDNILITNNGDYDPLKYNPIDFRHNDTLSVNFVLSDYYAYDDGTAENGAGLNQAGSYLAYLFNTRIDSVDTITYVDIYFPEYGDNTNQSLLLQIRSSLGDINQPPLLEQLIVVERNTRNKFARYQLYRPVLIGGQFYIGWKQITNASIPVGLDKNTDNGNRIYYNTTGDWVQNTDVKGSLMIRPGFGKGSGDVITGLEKSRPALRVYPNPSSGICTINAKAERVEAYDLTGRSIDLYWEHVGDNTRITLTTMADGLILLRVLTEGRLHTEKLMVRPAGR